MTERRRHDRVTTNLPAAIAFEAETVDCTIRNLSEGGACLVVPAATFVPSEFRLLLPGGIALACFVRWREDERFGVEFLPPSLSALW